MTLATVTDINEYRTRKNGGLQEAALNVYFSDWSDNQITTRHRMLEFIEAGHTDLIDPKQPTYKSVFPNGYDPGSHPGDNIDAVYAEGVRRGVFVKSQ